MRFTIHILASKCYRICLFDKLVLWIWWTLPQASLMKYHMLSKNLAMCWERNPFQWPCVRGGSLWATSKYNSIPEKVESNHWVVLTPHHHHLALTLHDKRQRKRGNSGCKQVVLRSAGERKASKRFRSHSDSSSRWKVGGTAWGQSGKHREGDVHEWMVSLSLLGSLRVTFHCWVRILEIRMP